MDIVVLGLFLGFADNKRNIEYYLPTYIYVHISTSNFYSSPPTTPHHFTVGTSRLFWLESSWSCSSPSSCSSSVCSQSSSLNEIPLEPLSSKSLSPWSWPDAECTEDPAGDVSLLSVRRTPLPELYSLFESAPTAVIIQKHRMDRWWEDFCKQTPHEKTLASQKSKAGT